MTSPTETAKHYGGGLKGNALRERFRRDITPFVQPVVHAVQSGIDPFEAVLISESGKGQTCFSASKHTARFPSVIHLHCLLLNQS